MPGGGRVKTYYAGSSDTRVSAGRVLLTMRFASDEEVFAVFSPAWARQTAHNLLSAADEAEADERGWTEQQAEATRSDAREDALDELGVARVDEHAPPAKPERKKKTGHNRRPRRKEGPTDG